MIKLNKSITDVSLATLLIFLATFFLTRQFPFESFSGLVSIFVILSFLAIGKKIYVRFKDLGKNVKVFYITFVVLFTIMLGYSIIIKHNSVVLAIRTYVTCMLLSLAYMFPNDKKFFKAFVYAVVLHCAVLIALELFMLINDSEYFNQIARVYIQSNGFGDIYTRNGMYFRIIAKGNELIPVAFMMAFNLKDKAEVYFKYILLAGIAISGNLASFIAVAVFCGIKLIMSKKYNKIIIRISLAAVVIAVIFNRPIMQYIGYILALKNESSLPVRYEQFSALIQDMKNGYDIFLGTGMGNLIKVKTYLRDYTNSVYFELQAVYFFNQLGIIFFSLLMCINGVLTYIYLKHKTVILIYFCYLLYAVTNPYVLNISHILVIIALVSYKEYLVLNYDK